MDSHRNRCTLRGSGSRSRDSCSRVIWQRMSARRDSGKRASVIGKESGAQLIGSVNSSDASLGGRINPSRGERTESLVTLGMHLGRQVQPQQSLRRRQQGFPAGFPCTLRAVELLVSDADEFVLALPNSANAAASSSQPAITQSILGAHQLAQWSPRPDIGHRARVRSNKRCRWEILQRIGSLAPLDPI
jgi:hypothetical protein